MQAFTLKQGINKFGNKGIQAATDELKQLHERQVFKPINMDELSNIEKKRAMESLIFLVEKKDQRIKARTCANGSIQRSYIGKDEAASPTVSTEAILLTGVIEAKEERDIMTADIPNAFVQTPTEEPKDGDRIIMKIKGPMVDMLVDIEPQTYKKFVKGEDGSKVIYVQVLKAIYGMLQSTLLFYKKLRRDFEENGFTINPYDPCVANKTVQGTQQTVTWHVDDLKSSHIKKEVNDEFLKWLNKKYGNKKIGEVKAHRGKIHNYLGMVLDFTEQGVLQVQMKDYITTLLNEFPREIGDNKKKYPWNQELMLADYMTKPLIGIKFEKFRKEIMNLKNST